MFRSLLKSIVSDYFIGLFDSIIPNFETFKTKRLYIIVILSLAAEYFFPDHIPALIWLIIEVYMICVNYERSLIEPPENERKIFKFQSISMFIGKIMDYFVVWINLEKIGDWVPVTDELLLPLYFSYHIFDSNLANTSKSFTFRLSYFRDRYPYYMGYGTLMTISYLMESYTIFTFLVIIASESRAVININEKHPKYSRWLPHNGRKYNTDCDEIMENGLRKIVKLIC